MNSNDDDVRSQITLLREAGESSMSQVEAAAALGWGLPRLRGAVHHGRIQAVHLSGSVRIPLAEIERVRHEEA